MPEDQTTLLERREGWAMFAIVALALTVRVALLPYATTDGGDAPSRVWAAWDWLSHPRLLTHGVWGPLHFYLIGLVLAVAPDPVGAPVALSLLFSVASAAVLYRFVRLEFAEPRAALLVGLTYAVYPIAIRNGVSVRSETPFVFFVLLALVALSHARGPGGSRRHAVSGGIALTLAAMLRYEAWLLIPLLAAVLWRRPKLAVLFVGCAVIHPIFWTLGNWLHSGDPLHGFTAAASWELESMGRSRLAWRTLTARAAAYPMTIVRGMSPPVGLLCVLGAALAVRSRHRSAVWLLPLAAMLGLWTIGILTGTLVPKPNYTEVAGTLLFPFSALVYHRLGVQRWPAARQTLSAIVLPLVSLGFTCRPCLARIGLGSLAAIAPVPRIENQATALSLARQLENDLSGADALVSDHYGWGATYYVALLTRLPRHRIFVAPGAPNQRLDPDSLAAFLSRHRHGILIAASGSRLARLLALAPDAGTAKVAEVSLRVVRIRSVGWPGSEPAILTVFRYEATPSASAARQRE